MGMFWRYFEALVVKSALRQAKKGILLRSGRRPRSAGDEPKAKSQATVSGERRRREPRAAPAARPMASAAGASLQSEPLEAQREW